MCLSMVWIVILPHACQRYALLRCSSQMSEMRADEYVAIIRLFLFWKHVPKVNSVQVFGLAWWLWWSHVVAGVFRTLAVAICLHEPLSLCRSCRIA